MHTRFFSIFGAIICLRHEIEHDRNNNKYVWLPFVAAMIGQAPITEITPIWREIQITLRMQYAAHTQCATRLAKVPSNESCHALYDDASLWNARS